KCGVDGATKIGGAGQFIAVTEDRQQARRNDAGGGGPADQPLRHAPGFQRLVQPLRPDFVLVAVADEGEITLDVGGRVHRAPLLLVALSSGFGPAHVIQSPLPDGLETSAGWRVSVKTKRKSRM